jgi:hypothetical protein
MVSVSVLYFAHISNKILKKIELQVILSDSLAAQSADINNKFNKPFLLFP